MSCAATSGRHTLSAQPLHVLLALIERPGGLVTRDELRARLWPADTYVDFEHGLNAVVKRLRDALGDSADTPRYIETVPRRGYRLVADVAAADACGADPGQSRRRLPPPAAGPPAPTPGDARCRRPRWRCWRLGGGLLLRAVEIRGGSLRDAVAGGGRPTDAAHVRAWPPDRRYLVARRAAHRFCLADRDGNFDLFIQSVDGGEPIRITSSPANETQPAWSPDGGRLAFRSDEDGGGLFTIGVTGGAVRRISNSGVQPTWMPGGRDIAYAGAYFQTIHVVRADGGEAPREILKGQLANGVWSSFSVHPDGRIGLFGINAAGRIGFYLSDRDP